MKRALFLDRDGTINQYGEYIYKIEDFKFIDGAIDFIKDFNCLGYKVFVVSNQAGIARGYYTENDLLKLQHYVDDVLLQHGAHIDEWFYCPHHPDKGLAPYNITCNCRKPKTGMVDKAVEKYDIDRQNSIMVGDKPWDIECGNRAGIQSFMLDEHGYIDLRLRISKKLGLIL